MKTYGQIFLNGNTIITHDKDIAEKIRILNDSPYFNGFFAGWSIQETAYQDIIGQVKESGKEFYLWLPVFGEFQTIKRFKPLQNISNDKINWKTYDNNESFEFYCPTSAVDLWIRIFEENFSGLQCDGVMLDRVRFPSLTIGLNALFTCTCDQCCEYYQNYGISRRDILELYREISSNIRQPVDINPLRIISYKEGNYDFENTVLQKYLDARNDLISKEVQKIYQYLREKGYLVGLDLFSPFMAYFLGQSYETISTNVDFIKTMLYRYTYTPAGIRYEIDSFAKAVCKDSSNPYEFNRKRAFFEELLGVDRESDFTTFIRSEYMSAKRYANRDVYIGIETNVYEGQCDITPSMIRRNKMDIAEFEADGIIASWDILTSPDANLKEFVMESKQCIH